MTHPPSASDRRLGALYGALLGDAAGVPFEFRSAASLATLPPGSLGLPYTPCQGFQRSHPGAPLHAWSDDGAQVLALLDSPTHAHPSGSSTGRTKTPQIHAVFFL